MSATARFKVGDEIAGPGPRASRPQRIEWYDSAMLSAATNELRQVGSNIHTDEEFAKSEGFAAANADGMIMTNWCSEMLVRAFGMDYLERGELRTKYIKPVNLGVELHVRGRVTRRRRRSRTATRSTRSTSGARTSTARSWSTATPRSRSPGPRASNPVVGTAEPRGIRVLPTYWRSAMSETQKKLKFFALETDSDGITVVTFDRPPVNAMSFEVYPELKDPGGHRRIDRPDPRRGHHVAARMPGPGAAAPTSTTSCRSTSNRDWRAIGWSRTACRGSTTSTGPVIAALNMHAIGVGFVMATFCDIRVASEEAFFAVPEIDRGVMAAGGSLLHPASTCRWARCARWC